MPETDIFMGWVTMNEDSFILENEVGATLDCSGSADCSSYLTIGCKTSDFKCYRLF